MIREEEVYNIGTIGKPHGVRGEVSLLFTDEAWDTDETRFLFLRVDGLLVPFMLEGYRFLSDSLALLKFRDYDDCDSVRPLSGLEVYFPRSLAQASGVGEAHTWDSLRGYLVRDIEGRQLGRVDEVDDSTPNVLLCVGPYLIPAVEDFVESVDHEGRILTMRLPEGLTEL